MKAVMGITYLLFVKLYNASLNSQNALHLISTTKVLLQDLREIGWGTLLIKVQKLTVFIYCFNKSVFLNLSFLLCSL